MFDSTNISAIKIASRLGLRQGKNGNWHCFDPLAHKHGDADPSLSIMYDGYLCFACGIKGNKIDLIQQVLGINRQAALKWLNDNFSGNDRPSASNAPYGPGKKEKSQIRYISKDPEDRFIHKDLGPDLVRDPTQKDVDNISRDLAKRYSLKTLQRAGIKICQNPYGMVYPLRSKRVCNPHKIKNCLYFEGGTDWLTAIEMELDEHFGLISIYNKTTKVTLKNSYEHIFVLDADVTPEQIRSRLIVKSEKGVSVRLIRLPERR